MATISTQGFTYFRDYRGKNWLTCVCLAEWLKYAQLVGIERGWIKQGLDIWQLTGSASASAGTHLGGGAFDILYQIDPKTWIKFYRDRGATATWKRTVDQGFDKDHAHGVLRGCPHVSPAAASQLKEQKDGPPNGGGDGLVGTRPDYHSDPDPYMTWDQGVLLMKRELGLLAVSTTTVLSVYGATTHPGDEVTLFASVTPTNAVGTFEFSWSVDEGKTWNRFAGAKVVNGKAEIIAKPGGSQRYKADFDPADETKFKASSGTTELRVVDLAKMDDSINDLQKRVAALENPAK